MNANFILFSFKPTHIVIISDGIHFDVNLRN